RGQVLRLSTQTVGGPSAHAWPAELHGSGVHQELTGGMIESVRYHRFHDGEVVRHLRQMRQQFRKLRAALSILGKLEFRAKQLRVWIDKCGSVTFQEFRWR